MPHILDSVSIFPPNVSTQEECSQKLKDVWRGDPKTVKLLERFHSQTKVEKRHLALPLDDYDKINSFEEKNKIWNQTALRLSEIGLQKLFDKWGLSPEKVDALFSSTVTGLSVPSLEAKLMNSFPFRPDVKRTPLFGLGCLAGVAGLNRVADYLLAYPKEIAIFITVELCSLTFQLDDFSLANIISTGLFGDGAAVVIMVGDDHPWTSNAPIKWLSGKSHFFENSQDVMGWDFKNTGFKIVLNAQVPQYVEKVIPPLLDEYFKQNQIDKSSLDFLIAHPGGPKVIEKMEECWGFPKNFFEPSWDLLKNYGNLSSVSVLVILDHWLREKELSFENGSRLGAITALGPAFCMELALIKEN